MVRPVIFFDGDDTLWRMQEVYDSIKQSYLTLLREEGIIATNIIELLDEIDASRVEVRGLTIERFTESMLILYAQLASCNGLRWNNVVETKIHRLVLTLKEPPKLYYDALPALDALMPLGQLMLVTSGDTTTQKRKVKSLALSKYFQRVFFVPIKTAVGLSEIVDQVNVRVQNSYFIGNSPRSDALPALNIGMQAIIVQRGNWHYDRSLFFESHQWGERLHAINSLTDAIPIILKGLKTNN